MGDDARIDWRQCEQHARKWFDYPGAQIAKACEAAYPDDFVAARDGRRSTHLWHVEFTWSRLWKNLWSGDLWGNFY